jgi:DNA invertase Pin-like site-specific DNA recombinase
VYSTAISCAIITKYDVDSKRYRPIVAKLSVVHGRFGPDMQENPKNNMILDGPMQATITATVLGLAAQIEREFISARTKEALSKRKQDGMKLGRPKGEANILKLDAFHDEITGYLKKGINKRAISKLIECSPSTLYQWLKRRRIHMNKSNSS